MKIAREHNQYYGRYIERGIVDYINNIPIQNYEDFTFPIDHIKTMNDDISIIANYLNSANVRYIGNHTTNENGDLVVDDNVVELKYTDSSLGTYFNTSTEFIRHIGFTTFSEYLKSQGYYNDLSRLGIEVNFNNVSPVSMAVSKNIRHNNPELYKKIINIEKDYRLRYVAALYQYLMNNTEARLQFIKNLITKEASNKSMPDRLIVFNHDTKWIREYNKQDILTCLVNDNLALSGGTIKMYGVHFTIAWQNGTGLNNPTIRVFLEG